MSRRILEVLFLVLSCTLFLGASFFITDRFIASSSPLGMNGERFIAMNTQSAKAKITKPAKNSSLYYRFTANQKVHLKQEVKANGGISLVADIKTIDGTYDQNAKTLPFQFGFLYEKSSSSGNSVAPANNFVSGDYLMFDQTGISSFRISISVGKDGVVPAGFFLHSARPCQIERVYFSGVMVGWDFSSPVPLYAFSDRGGTIEILESVSYDFTDSEKLFNSTLLPKITVKLAPTDDIGTWQKQKTLYARYGRDEIAIRRNLKNNTVTLQLAAFATPWDRLDFGSSDQVQAILLEANDPKLELRTDGPKAAAAEPQAKAEGCVLYPLVTDLGLIMDWPRDNWRGQDYELFEWEEVPHVLFFDFASYKIQGDFLTRLAYYVEKTGYRGTLVTDEFIASHHGYNAHDYKAKDLAAFYTAAAAQDFPLNEREYILRDILLANGVILDSGNGSYREGAGAVVSFSRESATYLRWQFMAHESWHGIYFTSPEFRAEVDTVYDSFDPKSLEFIQVFWETQPGLNYDRSDNYLMRNELMAYIMQQSPARIGPYFVSLAERDSVNQIEGKLAAYIRSTGAAAFVEAGGELNQWAFDNYGFAAGRVNLIYRE
jgi:hypothetical protein